MFVLLPLPVASFDFRNPSGGTVVYTRMHLCDQLILRQNELLVVFVKMTELAQDTILQTFTAVNAAVVVAVTVMVVVAALVVVAVVAADIAVDIVVVDIAAAAAADDDSVVVVVAVGQ